MSLYDAELVFKGSISSPKVAYVWATKPKLVNGEKLSGKKRAGRVLDMQRGYNVKLFSLAVYNNIRQCSRYVIPKE